MAPKPIIFAMANPDPEIGYDEALAARPDAIMATGRSDYPNQVNNVLGFPFIFREALGVRASAITEPMKLAAVHALAALARQDVPDEVARAYGDDSLRFGPEYIIPKPFDPRVLLWVAPAVAEAAVTSGVARRTIDPEAYRHRLERLLRARAPVHAPRPYPREPQAQAHRVPRGRAREDLARLPDRARGAHREARAARRSGAD
jgi:malate dehydrogenase (oxaloacetate-decarboxylating)(NADP+)